MSDIGPVEQAGTEKWTCLACGGRNHYQAEHCWNCGNRPTPAHDAEDAARVALMEDLRADNTRLFRDLSDARTQSAKQATALRQAGEALRRINDRLEAVHIDNWKEHDVDWHAVECLRDALAAIEALEVKP